MSQTFKKTVEDFTCEYCGGKVKGAGFTNHCSYCLWSKHVDNFPGDREADCDGIMEPVRLIKEGSNYKLVHRCLKCGEEKKNKLASNDDFDEAIKVVEKIKSDKIEIW